MAKFLIGVLTGIILVVLFLFIGVFAVTRLREKPPAVASGSTLILDLEGDVPEQAPGRVPHSLSGAADAADGGGCVGRAAQSGRRQPRTGHRVRAPRLAGGMG